MQVPLHRRSPNFLMELIQEESSPLHVKIRTDSLPAFGRALRIRRKGGELIPWLQIDRFLLSVRERRWWRAINEEGTSRPAVLKVERGALSAAAAAAIRRRRGGNFLFLSPPPFSFTTRSVIIACALLLSPLMPFSSLEPKNNYAAVFLLSPSWG